METKGGIKSSEKNKVYNVKTQEGEYFKNRVFANNQMSYKSQENWIYLKSWI